MSFKKDCRIIDRIIIHKIKLDVYLYVPKISEHFFIPQMMCARIYVLIQYLSTILETLINEFEKLKNIPFVFDKDKSSHNGNIKKKVQK